MPTTRSFVLALLGGLLVMASCSPPPFVRTDPPTPTNTGATRLAAAQCAQESRCNPDFFARRFGDEATCERNLVAADFQEYFVDPNVRLPDGFVDACVAALDAQKDDACSTTSPAACKPLPGVVAEGGSCLTGFDCAGGATCTFRGEPGDPPLTCGKCTAGPIAPCGGCPAGQTCTASGCAAKSREGEACVGETNCEDGLACNSGKCHARAKDGEACDPSSSAVVSCAKDHSCGMVSHTCRKVVYAAVDATCGEVGDDFVDCDRSLCIIPFGSFTGTCLAMVRDGDACDPFGAICEGNGRCVDGHCTSASVCW